MRPPAVPAMMLTSLLPRCSAILVWYSEMVLAPVGVADAATPSSRMSVVVATTRMCVMDATNTPGLGGTRATAWMPCGWSSKPMISGLGCV